jgi:phosphatidylserine decarboxylase
MRLARRHALRSRAHLSIEDAHRHLCPYNLIIVPIRHVDGAEVSGE